MLCGLGLYVNRAIAAGIQEPLRPTDLDLIIECSATVGVPPAVEVTPVTHPESLATLTAYEFTPDPDPATSVQARHLDQVVSCLATGQARAASAVASERTRTYHAIGTVLLRAQREQGWGAGVIERLATDLRARFPQQRGLSARNLRYMRGLAAAWPDGNLATAVATLPWTHITVLLSRVPDPELRTWYAEQAIQGRWSKRFLEDRIQGQLHTRAGAAPSNFTATLEASDAARAQALTRDPVLLEFLGLSGTVHEADIEAAMVAQITRTMLELGDGLAFVGRQVPLLVDDTEYFVDLLFYSIPQSRYVVVELKIGAFDPRDAGQLNFYVNVIDDQRRDPDKHAPTLGILLCGSHSTPTVRYALAGLTTPMAVATYTYETLPADARATLPPEQDLTRATTQLPQQPPHDRENPTD